MLFYIIIILPSNITNICWRPNQVQWCLDFGTWKVCDFAVAQRHQRHPNQVTGDRVKICPNRKLWKNIDMWLTIWIILDIKHVFVVFFLLHTFLYHGLGLLY
jgi:hypothetical protein